MRRDRSAIEGEGRVPLDIDKDVIKLKGYSVEQRKTYESAYPNLIYTNGVDFGFM